MAWFFLTQNADCV